MTKQQIDCELALRQILDYVDHELGDHDHSLMEQHLRTCKSCFSRMEFEQRLKRKVGELREDEVTSPLSERIKGLLKSF
ncbi:MAG TPA: zf-HC2 domain-containing protein [Burkholderiales bacterium]|jgi:anti-sigma factor (TIGR02949 family)|nr:zf-HC2 domain-containing protein [Burkholderiales bacterium]